MDTQDRTPPRQRRQSFEERIKKGLRRASPVPAPKPATKG